MPLGSTARFESVQTAPKHTVACTVASPGPVLVPVNDFAPVESSAGVIRVVFHVMTLNASSKAVVQWISERLSMHWIWTAGGGPTAGVGGTGVGVPGTGVPDGVGVGELNFTCTGTEPLLHTVTLHAVISTIALVSWLKVVENAVDPGATGAGNPLMLQRVVVYVPETLPVQVTPADFGWAV